MKEISILKVRIALLSMTLVATLSTACISQFASAQIPFTVNFDFDTCAPILAEGQNIPLNQTMDEVSAYFSSPSGPNAFYVASYSTTFVKLSQLSGKYLYPKSNYRDSMDIRFSMPINSISFTFATVEYHGGPAREPSNLTLTAYMDSTATTPVGTTKAHGTWPTGDYWPQGTLTFNSNNQQFNIVRIELPYQGANAGSAFLIDNVIVSGTKSPVPSATPTPSTSSPSHSPSPSPSISPSPSPPIPEFPQAPVLLVPMVATMLSMFLAKKRLSKHADAKCT